MGTQIADPTAEDQVLQSLGFRYEGTFKNSRKYL